MPFSGESPCPPCKPCSVFSDLLLGFFFNRSSPASPADGKTTAQVIGGFVRPPSRSVSLEQAITLPKSVPEKLDFSQLEKFEGTFMVHYFQDQYFCTVPR